MEFCSFAYKVYLKYDYDYGKEKSNSKTYICDAVRPNGCPQPILTP